MEIASNYVEKINGVPTMLGRMTVDQLVELEVACRHRMLEAQVDMQIVRYTRDQMEAGAEGAV